MSKQRRKQINEMVSRVEAVQAEVKSLLDNIQSITDEEAKYRDNIPENMQNVERYEIADHACCELEAARETLDNVKDRLEEVVSSLESAAE